MAAPAAGREGQRQSASAEGAPRARPPPRAGCPLFDPGGHNGLLPPFVHLLPLLTRGRFSEIRTGDSNFRLGADNEGEYGLT